MAREILLAGRTFKVRGLKRKEVKQLRRDGFNLLDLNLAQADDVLDRVFEMVFPEAEFARIDELLNRDCLGLWNAILIETYGSPEEEKNSSRSGNGTPTRTANEEPKPASA